MDVVMAFQRPVSARRLIEIDVGQEADFLFGSAAKRLQAPRESLDSVDTDRIAQRESAPGLSRVMALPRLSAGPE